ncbi:nucleolar protein 16 [Lingula anatina]|uniref:Nucleolar protein 16 n=1 Tax=Lingula anatina TaxID=7574 RepID=A0A1S3HGI0_LINAN|nr:nucleolar protein 16 [Lingula anatina]|eukprot:XP_013385162.1 nucleolar protein 16 [Lingula anatina]
MGKPRKTKKKFDYGKNRKRQWKKAKQLPRVNCNEIRGAWDSKRSVLQNMSDMGISYDPNKTIPVPKTKTAINPDEIPKETFQLEGQHQKRQVVQALEEQASIPQPRKVRLSQPEVKYCIYMMEKYGEDYKAMAKDEKNYYQETPKQIRRKIRTFMSIPEQYNIYLKSK